MGQSARYRYLVRRIKELEDNLLPPVGATGPYSAAEYDRTRAFRVLAHAEIESCIEDLAFSVAESAYTRWTTDGRSRRPIAGLLAYHTGVVDIRAIKKAGGAPGEIQDQARKAKDAFRDSVRLLNNGIREKDLLALLLPVGVAAGEIDNTWLATTDSFGKNRGLTAHLSSKVTSLPDPQGERATVGLIVSGLATVDQKLSALRW